MVDRPFVRIWSGARACIALIIMAIGAGAGAVDVITDNDAGSPGYAETGTGWLTTTFPGYNGGNYRYSLTAGDTATWTPVVPYSTSYAVSAVFRNGANRPAEVIYTITHVSGTTQVGINQQGPGDLVEVPLGAYSFAAGTAGNIRMFSPGGGACIADAIILRMGTPDDDPPVITSVVRLNPNPTAGAPVSIRALVADEGSITSAAIVYRVSPPGWRHLVQAFDDGAHNDLAAGDGVYGATIPAQDNGTSVTFVVVAWDNEHRQGRSQTRTYYVGRNPEREFRAIWADSWAASFRSAAEADELITTCRAANINVVMPEVRKIGDAYYNSALEPRATNIIGPPDFDPLQYVLDIAHDTSGGKNRLQVHAWFVMNRIWTGGTLPAGHVLALHPEYEMLKSDGTYTSTRYLDPGHPGATDHNVAVILDCLEKYDIDGYHFDYIRFPEAAGNWGYNPTSVARFNAVHNRTGSPKPWDPLWHAWRRECVDLQVKKIYVKAWKLKPNVLLTAATVNWGWAYDDWTRSTALNHVFQDWSGWLQKGIMDYNSLMSYSRLTDPARHQGWTERSLADDGKRGSIIGIAAYLSATVQGSVDQLLYARSAGAAGLNIYDWGSEVNSAGGASRAQFYDQLKAQVFPTWVEPPEAPWRTNPTTGIFEGNVIYEGQPVDHATVRLAGQPETETVTDGSGWYAIMDVPPGPQTVEFRKDVVGGIAQLTASASIPAAGDIVTLDAQLQLNTSVPEWTRY
jgi:uncharacterized lipoprotein YddW (UPF0748 family)